MKKFITILTLTPIIAFAQPTAQDNVSVSFGQLEDANLYGIHYANLKGANTFGLTAGIQFGSSEQDTGFQQVGYDYYAQAKLTTSLVITKLGFVYGLTDWLYIGPHVGLDFVSLDAILCEGSSYGSSCDTGSDSTTGFNFGGSITARLNDFTLGLDVTKHSVDYQGINMTDEAAMNFKIGYTF